MFYVILCNMTSGWIFYTKLFFYLITRWGSWFPFINWNWGYFSLTTAKYLIKKINSSFIRGNWLSEIASTSVVLFVWFPHYPSVNYSQYIRIAFCEGNALYSYPNVLNFCVFASLMTLSCCKWHFICSFARQLHDTLMITNVSEWPIFLYWDLYGHERWTRVDGFVLHTLNTNILTDY